jgi:2-C-methyl-D-erythritol 4-phosphate cytidylyltransferase
VVETALTVVLVAAGRGTRLGGENKVWRQIDGRPLWWWAASRFSDLVREAVVVVSPDRVADAGEHASALPFPVRALAGGRERWESSAIGIRAVTTAYVAVHDAARPLVSSVLITRVLHAARETGAALPGLPATDTVKLVEHGHVKKTLPRASVILAQTPQIFRTDWAMSSLRQQPGGVTDDVSWLEAAGHPVAVVEGESVNRKVTTGEDWDWLLQHWRDPR